jgi:hypothetical protein
MRQSRRARNHWSDADVAKLLVAALVWSSWRRNDKAYAPWHKSMLSFLTVVAGQKTPSRSVRLRLNRETDRLAKSKAGA